jgi:vacuole morphology and inheritance protein 14
VPELELITYLPHLLDGLLYVIFVLTPFLSYLPFRKYLSDPTEDVRIVAENLLAEFLREIREVTIVRKHREEQERLREPKPEENNWLEAEAIKERSSDIAIPDAERATSLNGNLPPASSSETDKPNEEVELDLNERNAGGKFRRYAALVDAHSVQTGFPARVFESIMLQ